MTPAAPSLSSREVLRLPGVARLWTAQIVSVFGDFLALFAVVTVIAFRMHGTPTQVGLIIVAYMLPLAFLGPLAGAFADRWHVRTTMISSDLIRSALVLLLVFARDVNEIYLTFFLLSAVSSFFIPSQSITVRAIVPTEGLLNANALMSQAVQGMQIITPAIAGLLVTWLGADVCFVLDAVSFLFSALMIYTLSIDHQPVQGPLTVRAIAASVAEGMKFIFTHGAISFVILAMTAGMFAIRCFSALLAVYVRDVLSANAMLFGTLSSSVGIGMIAGTQFVSAFAKTKPKNGIVVAGLFGVGLAILEVALFGTVTATLIGMFSLGFFVAFIMVPAQTLLQQETPRAMLGRVSSSLWSVLAMAQIGAMVVAGPVAQKFGIANLYCASAVLLLIFAAAGYWRIRTATSFPRAPQT